MYAVVVIVREILVCSAECNDGFGDAERDTRVQHIRLFQPPHSLSSRW